VKENGIGTSPFLWKDGAIAVPQDLRPAPHLARGAWCRDRSGGGRLPSGSQRQSSENYVELK